MKTYLLNSVDRYKRFSQSLDVKAILCNKSWSIFNDTGKKEIYLFQSDGSLIISVSGIVTDATWKYISANQSILIKTQSASYLLHPSFIDDIIFVLQLDGTNQYSFMIDELHRNEFAPKCLSDIENYFNNKEQETKQQEDLDIQIRIENDRKIQYEHKEKLKEQEMQNEVNEYLKSDSHYIHLTQKFHKTVTAYWIVSIMLIIGYISMMIYFYYTEPHSNFIESIINLVISLIGLVMFLLVASIFFTGGKQQRIEKYRNQIYEQFKNNQL